MDENEFLAKLTALQESMKEISTKIDPLVKARDEISAEKAQIESEYRARMASLNQKDEELRTLIWETKRNMRTLESEVASTERQYQQYKRLAKQQEAFAKISERWDKLTAGAPWREWAKEHQLEAGRKMSWQTKMILADGMGLGKTLSAIIALDFVKAATENATPDNPIVFDIQKGTY